MGKSAYLQSSGSTPHIRRPVVYLATRAWQACVVLAVRAGRVMATPGADLLKNLCRVKVLRGTFMFR